MYYDYAVLAQDIPCLEIELSFNFNVKRSLHLLTCRSDS